MKIRTQLIAGLVTFALLLVIISGLVITTNQQAEHLVEQERIANSIALEVGELGYLSNDYILHREPPQAERWNAKFSSISDHIAGLSVDRPEQQAIVRNLEANLKNTGSVFDDIVSSPAQPGGTDIGLVRLSWSRMAVQNQGMVFDAGRLANLLRDQEDELSQARNLLIFALMGAFVALLLTSYFLFSRRTLKSIADLQEGARIIGSGNLDHAIPEKGDDEITELSRSFNLMTADLKGVTASKADLEREVASRKLAEENLVRANERLSRSEQDLLVKNDDLNALNEELTATQEELQQNLDELTRAEAKVQRLAQQRQIALDAARLGWWHYDPITKVASWDERYREIFGVTGYQSPNDEILATRMHPKDREGVWAKVEAALDPVDPQTYSAEYRINLPDGSMRWIEAHGIASFEGVGESRQATSFVGTVADITERKLAEEALRWLSQFPEKNPSPVLRVAADGALLYANAPAQDWLATLGWQADGPLPDQVHALAEDARRQHQAVESEICNPAGSTFWLSAVQPPGEDYVNLYGRNITERKQAEEERQQLLIQLENRTHELEEIAEKLQTANEELQTTNEEMEMANEELQTITEELALLNRELEEAHHEANLYLDIMTHDVRNANNVSSMYADLLVDLAEGDLKTYVGKLHDSIDRSTEILKNVDTIRRVQSESARLVPVDLDAAIREEIGNFPGASIRYEGWWSYVLADSLLPGIFTNLIGNAVKFGGPGVKIAIHVEERDGEVLVSVEDTGPGVPDEVKDKLFTRFERGMAKGKGEGLGLFIVRTLVTRYGGRVWIEDRVPGHPEEGAAFRFTLREPDRT